MKKKDTIYLVLAVLIFLVAGYIGYTQLLGNKKSAKTSTVTVETVGPLPSSFDTAAVTQLNDQNTVRDFNSPVDLSGLGNTAPFGP